jgi:hypothetical protein
MVGFVSEAGVGTNALTHPKRLSYQGSVVLTLRLWNIASCAVNFVRLFCSWPVVYERVEAVSARWLVVALAQPLAPDQPSESAWSATRCATPRTSVIFVYAGASCLLSLFAALAHDQSEPDCRSRGHKDASVQRLHGGERRARERFCRSRCTLRAADTGMENPEIGGRPNRM